MTAKCLSSRQRLPEELMSRLIYVGRDQILEARVFSHIGLCANGLCFHVP